MEVSWNAEEEKKDGDQLFQPVEILLHTLIKLFLFFPLFFVPYAGLFLSFLSLFSVFFLLPKQPQRGRLTFEKILIQQDQLLLCLLACCVHQAVAHGALQVKFLKHQQH